MVEGREREDRSVGAWREDWRCQDGMGVMSPGEDRLREVVKFTKRGRRKRCIL